MKTKCTLFTLFLAHVTLLSAQSHEIAVVVKAKESAYWDIVHAGVIKANADLARAGTPVVALWDGPATEGHADEQRKIVEAYVDRKVAAIVLAPSNGEALVPAVEKAKAAGIPVVLIDSLLSSDIPVSTLATNNYKAGLLAARRLAESLGGTGKVALFRFMKGQGSSQPRESGFLDGIKKYSGIQVVSSDMQSGATTEEAERNAEALLAKVGSDLQGVFASNMVASEGMLVALKAAGLAGKVKFVGFDSTPALLDGLRKGELAGLAVQQPFMMGYLGLKTAVDAADHKSVDHEIDTEVKIVTKGNLDTPDVQALLNPGKA